MTEYDIKLNPTTLSNLLTDPNGLAQLLEPILNQVLTPVTFPQLPIPTEQFVRTLALQELHRPGYRYFVVHTK